MNKNQNSEWLPTPAFLYRNYLYKKIAGNLPKKLRFLDVGAGNGRFLFALLNIGFKGESIDISEDAVRLARSQFPEQKNLVVKLANIFTYNPKDKYDVVFCFEVLEHIEDDKLAIKKIYNLLKPGGIFIMSVPAHMSMWSKIDDVKGHYRRYEREELINKITQTGFVINKVYTYGFPFLNLVRFFSGSGKYVKSKTQSLDKQSRGQESSIQQEYSPKLKMLLGNELLMYPIFKIMDLFIGTDLGQGYIVISKKPEK